MVVSCGVIKQKYLDMLMTFDDAISSWHFRGIGIFMIMLPLGNHRAVWKHVETAFQGAPTSAFSLAAILEDAEVSQTEPGGHVKCFILLPHMDLS